jgi:SAM-dependent methyltransferase
MDQPIVFDMPHAMGFTNARKAWLDGLLPPLITAHGYKTAVDVGCGVGYFSAYLQELGLRVVATDGRAENVAEAQRRLSGVTCVVGDVEDRALRQLGVFDVVLCVGLLYHLENPFAAVRNLYALTGRLLIVESVVMPGRWPGAVLLDEPGGRDQALQDSVLVVSEPALIKMLYRAGFAFVYRADPLPDHDDFRESPLLLRRRTVVVASAAPVDSPLLRRAPEPSSRSPWEKVWATRVWRVARFIRHGRR